MPDVLVSHAIQLAVAPVFLLSGMAGLLSVMTNRLARVVDRTRYIQQSFAELDEQARALACAEIRHLDHRRHLASWAINFCTAGALVICLVIVALFMDDLLSVDVRALVAALFVCALVALIGGLTCFLREVYLATQAIAIETARFDQLVASSDASGSPYWSGSNTSRPE